MYVASIHLTAHCPTHDSMPKQTARDVKNVSRVSHLLVIISVRLCTASFNLWRRKSAAETAVQIIFAAKGPLSQRTPANPCDDQEPRVPLSTGHAAHLPTCKSPRRERKGDESLRRQRRSFHPGCAAASSIFSMPGCEQPTMRTMPLGLRIVGQAAAGSRLKSLR